MRYLFSILLVIFIGQPLLSQVELVHLPAEEVLLEELMVQLEARYGLLFSYHHEDVEGLKVRLPEQALQLPLFLEALLKDSGIDFEIVDTRFVLLSKQQILELATPETVPEELFELCGTVLDSLTGNPLMAANVYLKSSLRGTSTLANGSFRLMIPLSSQADTVIVSYVGYEEQKITVQALKSCPDILLDYYSFGEDFLIITEYLTDGILSGNNGTFTQLQSDKIGVLPGQLEPDVLNTIQFLPGVSSIDGSPAGIGIQGGTPGQNLILWEDIPVYHTAHYFGTLTAINPFIVDKVSVYTGGFGAEYGGRVSGVIDLETNVNEQKDNTVGIGTNLIHGFLDGQLVSKDRKLSVVYAVRQSMTNLWEAPSFKNISKRVQQGILVQNVDLNRLPDGIQINDDLSFLDANLKLNYRLSEKDEFSVASFYANNDFEDFITDDDTEQIQADTFSLQASGLHFSWQHQWSSAVRTRFLALHTNYGYDYGYSVLNKQIPNKIGRKQSDIQERQIHLTTDIQTNWQHQLKLGYQLINYDVAFDISRNQLNDGGGNRSFLSNLHVLYASLKTNPARKLGVEAGLRFNHYEEIKKQYLAPRLRLWYNFNDDLNFYISGGKYYQYLTQLIEFKGDEASIETPVWGLAGSKDVPVLDANHFQWGMIYQPNTWLIDVQAYLKKVDGLTSLASGFDEGLSSRFHIGTANIQGISLLVKKRWKHYKSWLSYAWSNVDHQFPSFFDQEFSATLEQKHRLRWAHIWTYKQLEFSLGWNISSGRPFSNRFDFALKPSSNGMGANQVVIPTQDEFNGSQLPAEHQLDASLLYRFQTTSLKGMKGLVGISLYNIYHQRNIYNRELYIDDQPNMPATLAYNNKVNIGFMPNFLVRLNW